MNFIPNEFQELLDNQELHEQNKIKEPNSFVCSLQSFCIELENKTSKSTEFQIDISTKMNALMSMGRIITPEMQELRNEIDHLYTKKTEIDKRIRELQTKILDFTTKNYQYFLN